MKNSRSQSNHFTRCKKFAGIIVTLFAMFNTNANAGGIPVIDAANIQQTTVAAIENVSQTLKQIQQYQTQLQQYENMIRNTLAPPAYIWAQAQYTMNKLMHMTDTIRYFGQRYGGLDGYLQRFRNVNYYRSSPCFNLDGNCTESAWSILKQGQDASTDAQKNANDAVLRGLDHHSQQIPLDAAQLQMLQQRTQPLKDKWKHCNMPTNSLPTRQTNYCKFGIYSLRNTMRSMRKTKPKSIRKPCGRLLGKRQPDG